MTKKGKLRKGISILLAVCMALPVGFVLLRSREKKRTQKHPSRQMISFVPAAIPQGKAWYRM